MTINVLDASNYFKGLLLLIRKDRKVTPAEIEAMKRIGKTLGFERKFCENAIAEILENAFIVDEPPHFPNKELAYKFIRDGLFLAFIDHRDIDPHEERWLRLTVEKNDIQSDFFIRELEVAKANRGDRTRLEVDDLTVEHS
jgi:hypothetical protein